MLLAESECESPKEFQDGVGLVYGPIVPFTALANTSVTNEARLVRAAVVTNPVSQPDASTITRAEIAAISVFLARIMVHSRCRKGYRMSGNGP